MDILVAAVQFLCAGFLLYGLYLCIRAQLPARRHEPPPQREPVAPAQVLDEKPPLRKAA